MKTKPTDVDEPSSQWIAIDGLDLTLRLTLLMLLFGPVGEWNVRALILLLCGAGLVFPTLLRKPVIWLSLTLLTGWRVMADYPLADNHAYLLCYWCLAITCALVAREPKTTLAFHGKLLIGSVFLLAAFQKGVVSPDFRNDIFFRHTLSEDSRFENFAILAGGVDRQTLEGNRQYFGADIHADQTSGAPLFNEPPSLRRLASLMTWGTLAIESALALCFLWPSRNWLFRQRNNLLIIFCLTTYAVATVAGFGRLLLIMGLAQSGDAESRETRLAYLATFALMLIYEDSPWLTALANWGAG